MELTSINQHYRMGIATSLSEIGRDQWDTLLQSQLQRNPFLSYTFLDALHETHCACKATGWQPCFITLWDDDNLVGAYPLYQKCILTANMSLTGRGPMLTNATDFLIILNYYPPFHLPRSLGAVPSPETLKSKKY